MWLITRVGFFSVVRKEGDSFLTVRSRCSRDLERLRDEFAANVSEIYETFDNDYPWRSLMWPEDFARLMAELAMDVTYSNFKCEIWQNHPCRALVYTEVHDKLVDIEDEEFERGQKCTPHVELCNVHETGNVGQNTCGHEPRLSPGDIVCQPNTSQSRAPTTALASANGTTEPASGAPKR